MKRKGVAVRRVGRKRGARARADEHEADTRRERRTSGQLTAKSISIKDAKRKSGACAPKAIETSLGVWSGAVVLPLLSGVVVWPLAALIRRLLGNVPVSQGPETVARKVAGVTALLALAFVAGLAMVVTRTMEEDPFVLAFGVPSWAAPLFWLPWAVAPLTIAAAFFAAQAWREKFWSIVGRAHYWAVVSGCLGFVVFVIHWELW